MWLHVAHCEKGIAEIWVDVLGVERVGIHDNFFDLGGHSLGVIKAIALMEDKLGVTASFRDFIGQTLGQLAAALTEPPA